MRRRFSAVDAGSSSDELTMADSGEWHVDEGSATCGKGHVLSLLLSGPNSLIFSERYHCISAVRPFGRTIGGIVEGRLTLVTLRNDTAVGESLQVTCAIKCECPSKVKWWILLMPLIT